jgi:hypothetical protein
MPAMGKAPTVIDLASLPAGFPHLTSAFCATLAESGRVCFDEHGHPRPVKLKVRGTFRRVFHVKWEPATDQLRRTYNDEEVATENGAYGVAFFLIRELTGLQVIERSRKGTGFDFWLGGDGGGLPFQNKARLEVSGIRRGDSARVKARVEQKKRQTERSAGKLPAYIVVVEFAAPMTQVAKK